MKKYNLGVTYRKQDGWDSFLNRVDKIVPEKNDNSDYQEGIKQGVTHLFALAKLKEEKAFNHLNKTNGLNLDIKSIQDAQDIKFINLLFEPNEKKYDDEHTKFNNYQKLYDEFRKIVQDSKIIDIPIDIDVLTYSELWKMAENDIKKVDKGHLHQYLEERYMRFAVMK